jgi:hypothetical protein
MVVVVEEEVAHRNVSNAKRKGICQGIVQIQIQEAMVKEEAEVEEEVVKVVLNVDKKVTCLENVQTPVKAEVRVEEEVVVLQLVSTVKKWVMFPEIARMRRWIILTDLGEEAEEETVAIEVPRSVSSAMKKDTCQENARIQILEVTEMVEKEEEEAVEEVVQ